MSKDLDVIVIGGGFAGFDLFFKPSPTALRWLSARNRI
jgi:hypothetical protein